jgi:hypothetical protein
MNSTEYQRAPVWTVEPPGTATTLSKNKFVVYSSQSRMVATVKIPITPQAGACITLETSSPDRHLVPDGEGLTRRGNVDAKAVDIHWKWTG